MLAALVVWRRTQGLPLARALAIILAVIGVGSFLWHTHATGWASLTDVVPIMMFILLYLFAATRDFLGVASLWAGAVTLAFFPYAAAFAWMFGGLLPGGNALYASVAVLIAGYGLWLWRSRTGRGLMLGAGLFAVSLVFRMGDEAVCGAFPVGTHFLWHILNGIMLGWMIVVYCHHRRAGPLAPRVPSG